MSQKPHRMYVVVKDGKPREPNKLKGLLVPHVDIIDAGGKIAFYVNAVKEDHLNQVRAKLATAGLDEASVPKRPDPFPKPYGFVALPQELKTSAPIWHDGTNSAERLSGEIRFELEALTPLLVGWERQILSECAEGWPVPLRKVSRSECASFVQAVARAIYPDATDSNEQKRKGKQKKIENERSKYVQRTQDRIVDVQVQGAGWSIDSKSVLCPLRAPWGKRPVVIPGDSLKGLLRHELGALLGAPMERVAERTYSYRPNAKFPNKPGPTLIARLARVPSDSFEPRELEIDIMGEKNPTVRVPTKLELLSTNLLYDKKKMVDDKWEWTRHSNYHRFDDDNGATYRGGQGAGERLNSKQKLHNSLTANPDKPIETVPISREVQDGFLATVRHLLDKESGHFSERHPDVPKVVTGDDARSRILKAVQDEVFQPGDLIWVEWDTKKKCIVSLGWHYYYRWAYTDSVRQDADAPNRERHGLFPLSNEREKDGDAPKELSLVRRLFGYAHDKANPGTLDKYKDGKDMGDHSQLMGRIFVNAGLEVVGENDSDEARFLKPTFLKELGMPRPSAVEHYLKQPHHPSSRPSDRASLVTYGDAAGYDAPGELAGRKFYLDRPNAVAEDASDANKQNDRSTLALEASKAGRKFRFTIRFRDIDADELAAILIAMCPDQFKNVLGGTHNAGYCSKLGYARPLGWGSVSIEAKQLLLLDEASDAPTLKPEGDLSGWVMKHHQKTSTQGDWLAIHQRNHPAAGDYPRQGGQIYTYHTTLRADHSRDRRYR